jgi:hypothetical protein
VPADVSVPAEVDVAFAAAAAELGPPTLVIAAAGTADPLGVVVGAAGTARLRPRCGRAVL